MLALSHQLVFSVSFHFFSFSVFRVENTLRKKLKKELVHNVERSTCKWRQSPQQNSFLVLLPKKKASIQPRTSPSNWEMQAAALSRSTSWRHASCLRSDTFPSFLEAKMVKQKIEKGSRICTYSESTAEFSVIKASRLQGVTSHTTVRMPQSTR